MKAVDKVENQCDQDRDQNKHNVGVHLGLGLQWGANGSWDYAFFNTMVSRTLAASSALSVAVSSTS